MSSSSSSEGVVWKRKGRVGGEGIEMENGCCTTTTKSSGGGGGGGYNNVDDHQQKKKKRKNKNKNMNMKKIKSTMNGKNEEKRYELLTYRELPEYMKDNEYILGYYRSEWPIKAAFFSLFRWHNETLNIWTHLLGFVLFVGLTMANLMQVPQLADLLHKFTRSFAVIPAGTNASFNSKDFFSSIESTIDFARMMPSDLILTTSTEIPVTKWPFFVFLAGSMFCLLTSSICHLFCCHSHRLNLLLLRFDYVGIVVMIITSFFPPIYYIFQCEPRWQFVYLTAITVMGIFTIVTLLAPSASTSGCRTFRASLFVAMGFFGIIPAIHATIVNWNEPRRWMTLAYETSMALSYAIGTLFYVSRIPERWKPGNFDLAGHSHQIFHVFVILGALSHYGAVLIFLDWRGTVGCNRV